MKARPMKEQTATLLRINYLLSSLKSIFIFIFQNKNNHQINHEETILEKTVS